MINDRAGNPFEVRHEFVSHMIIFDWFSAFDSIVSGTSARLDRLRWAVRRTITTLLPPISRTVGAVVSGAGGATIFLASCMAKL
jgi:hypothetical protein